MSFLHVDVKERTFPQYRFPFRRFLRSVHWFFPGLILEWWAWLDSNQWPRAYQARALTNWATGPCWLIVDGVWLIVAYQLSTRDYQLKMVEVNGFEPLTFCLQSRRSTNWAKPPLERRAGNLFLLTSRRGKETELSAAWFLRGRDSNKCSSLETIAGLPKPTCHYPCG